MGNNKSIPSIPDTTEAWENGDLGRDPAFAVKSKLEINETDLGLQMISIRLQKSLIEDLKTIAEYNGIGYQPLIKQILSRFVNAEMKMLANELMEKANTEKEQTEEKGNNTSKVA